MNKLIQRSFLNALGTVIYVSLVVAVMFNAEKIFGSEDQNITGPITFLLLFILSATVTSGLVLGKPILMYLENQKIEAVKLLIYTVGWLGLAVLLLLMLNIIF
jgi:hypothetical protein